MPLYALPQALLVGVAIALGLLFGSFLNVVIHRLPRGQSVAYPPSSCPACGARIRPTDNVPVLSWLLLRGRARCCKAAISPRYPLVEALGGLVGWGIVHGVVLTLAPDTPLWQAGLLFAAYFALAMGLLAALFIDLDHMILPDEITLGGTVVGLISLPLRDMDWQDALIGGAFGFLIVWLPFDVLYRWLRGHPGMGLGDAKLLMLAGTWFGWPGALFALLAGSIQGTVVAISVWLTRGRLEEPQAVKDEREALREELEGLPESERRRLLDELDDDVLLREPDAGLGGARLAFGPFLILSIFEFLFLGRWLEELFFEVFWLA